METIEDANSLIPTFASSLTCKSPTGLSLSDWNIGDLSDIAANNQRGAGQSQINFQKSLKENEKTLEPLSNALEESMNMLLREKTPAEQLGGLPKEKGKPQERGEKSMANVMDIIRKKIQALARKEEILSEWQKTMEARGNFLTEWDKVLSERAGANNIVEGDEGMCTKLGRTHTTLAKWAEALDKRQDALTEWQENIAQNEDQVVGKEDAVVEREDALNTREDVLWNWEQSHSAVSSATYAYLIDHINSILRYYAPRSVQPHKDRILSPATEKPATPTSDQARIKPPANSYLEYKLGCSPKRSISQVFNNTCEGNPGSPRKRRRSLCRKNTDRCTSKGSRRQSA